MATEVRHRRGTTVQHATFTGALAEITVDTDKKTAVVHDGLTAGGFPLSSAIVVSGKANSGANSDITSLSGLTTALSVAQGGTGQTSLPALKTALGAASSGANSDITSLSALTVFNGVQKRQTVLSGAQTRIAIGTGLAVNLLATTTPIRVSFAGGIGAQGTIDRVSTLSADVTGFWSGLTANVVNYLFYDRNTGTGAITGVASILPYIAQNSSVAISVVNGQHTYVYDTGQMYVGNGATATAVDRTAEGECLAGAATITTVTSYAMQREYDSGYTATIPAVGTAIAKSHNIGTNVKLDVKFLIECTTIDAGWPVGYILPHYGLSGFTGTYAYVVAIGFNRLVGSLTIPTTNFLLENSGTGALSNITTTSWKYKIVANTPW